jgi:uridine kinase
MIIETILTQMPVEQSLLVGISGIDASGKGFITAKLAEEIQQKGFNAANINLDGWLNLPHIRFNPNNPAEHFYENAIRFDEMFETLILPLRENRSIQLTADFAEETATEFRKHKYNFENIDIILLEGIFLFKNEFRTYFDLRIWIECSFEMALQRAIARSQEGLSSEETIKVYETIYFPAQKIHFAEDNPRKLADLIYNNEYGSSLDTYHRRRGQY